VTNSRWRQAAGVAVLAILILLGVRLIPIYLHNQELQQFVEEVTHRAVARTSSDDVLRSWILTKAADLELPVMADNVHIEHGPEKLHIDVRYMVRVNLPLYTVDLHFYPGAGSR
jgi:predicted lipid carrier protein YhbT